MNNEEKFPYLVKHIESQHGLMLVFVKTKRGAKKLAKALDLMAIHGINPRSGEKSPIIGGNNFNDKVNQEVTYNSSNPQLNIDTGPFSLEELQLAKKQIVEGKAHGDEGISPEVMRRVVIDILS